MTGSVGQRKSERKKMMRTNCGEAEKQHKELRKSRHVKEACRFIIRKSNCPTPLYPVIMSNLSM